MKSRAKGARAVATQWPRVIARSFGVSTHPDMLPPTGQLPSHPLWNGSAFGACWLGQSTVLLRLGGLNILTDPHFEDHAGPPMGARAIGRRRSTALPAKLDELPPIDLVMLSHAHFDHWDKRSLARLAEHSGRHATVVIPHRTRRLLPRGFGEVAEMTWNESVLANGLRITSIKPRHWGARWLWDRYRGYNAYLLEAPGRRVLFGGDTAHTDAFDPIGHEGGVDVAILGIGNYEPWEHAHATPEQAADMAQRMGARALMPVHHSTFRDETEPLDEPLRRLLAAWNPRPVLCPRVGDSWLESSVP